MRLVALSDTHGLHGKVTVPDGDILVYAGDFCTHGFSYGEVFQFRDWFKAQPHKYKVLVAGNHDRLMEMHTNLIDEFTKDGAVSYLWDSGVTFEGVTFWGSPYTPWFNNWAFNEHKDNMHRHWDIIPVTDVLITHGPPYGIRDSVYVVNGGASHLGDQELLKALYRVKPKVHIFGHIHTGYGYQYEPCDTGCYNVSICDESYKVRNPCTVVEIG